MRTARTGQGPLLHMWTLNTTASLVLNPPSCVSGKCGAGKLQEGRGEGEGEKLSDRTTGG